LGNLIERWNSINLAAQDLHTDGPRVHLVLHLVEGLACRALSYVLDALNHLGDHLVLAVEATVGFDTLELVQNVGLLSQVLGLDPVLIKPLIMDRDLDQVVFWLAEDISLIHQRNRLIELGVKH
jgi:hypothetical protein